MSVGGRKGMVLWQLFNSGIFTLVVIPILIFSARLCDVTLGTLRSIFVVRGIRFAPLIGFFEVLIWILAMGVILQNLNNPVNYVAYAGGFATGNFVGMAIGKRMVMGFFVLRIITGKDPASLIERFEAEGYGITVVDGYGRDGPVKIIFTVLRRENIQKALETIMGFDDSAFYSLEEMKGVSKSPSLQTEAHIRRHAPWVVLDRKGK